MTKLIKTKEFLFIMILVFLGIWVVPIISCELDSGTIGQRCFEELVEVQALGNYEHVKIVAIDDYKDRLFIQTNLGDDSLSTIASILEIRDLNSPYEQIFSVEFPELILSVDFVECCFSISTISTFRVYDSRSFEMVIEIAKEGNSPILADAQTLYYVNQSKVQIHDLILNRTEDIDLDIGSLALVGTHYDRDINELHQNYKQFKNCLGFAPNELGYLDKIYDEVGWYVSEQETVIVELSSCNKIFRTDDRDKYKGTPRLSAQNNYTIFYNNYDTLWLVDLVTGDETKIRMVQTEFHVTDAGAIWVSDLKGIYYFEP